MKVVMLLAYSFEEIMDYHPDNKDVYSEIKENLSNLVPFVGAGLTQFAYPSWKQALTELSDKITNKTDSKQVKQLIRDGHYMDAAQQLENLRTQSNLARDIAHLFSSDHLSNKIGELPKEAISLLPWLFHGLVLTTNFDETLETVYRKCGYPFQTVSHPGHPVLEQFIRNQNHCGLFKMHGTVTGNLIEYENIVFTSAQYDRHYGKGSPLIHDLKACFEKRLMFFLGCSLEKDRTMDILQDAIIQGVNHYAIIECKKSERDKKARKLGEKYIRVILYEQGRHEAVRVILEHLLEETRPDIYKKIRPVSALKPHSPSDRFSYDAGIVPLSGRKKELGELNSFLQTPDMPFQWWAITGPAGCGKSRLAYEFQNQLPPGWLARYLKQSDYKNLHGMNSNLTQKTLLIADYVQEHARELGEWMESLNDQPHSLPIRLLLVEREFGREQEDSAWTKQLYSDVHNEIKLKKSCYRKTFLSLSQLSDQNLLDIMENYVAAIQVDKLEADRVPTDTQKQMLLNKLKAIDSDLCRPLYAMFLADAYVNSNDIEQWKREDILDYVISREKKRLQFSIRNVMHTTIMDQKLYNACVYLQCAATVLQDVPVENLQKLFPDVWKIIECKSEYFESPVDFLYQIGLIVKDELPALRPDLVGEYFVYDWLFKNREKAIQDFIFAIWKTPIPTGIFFERLFIDFCNLLNVFPERWKLLLPNSLHLSENSIVSYAMLMVCATYGCNIVVHCEKMVDSLEKFVINYPDMTEIAVHFSSCLVNLSVKQDEQGAERTVRRLEKLCLQYPDVMEIKVSFAKGLSNLSIKQDEQRTERTVRRLEKLSFQHPDVTEIVVTFAHGLAILSVKQNEKDTEKTVNYLEKLHLQHQNVSEITHVFAIGLVSLSYIQDKQGVERSVKRLEKLYLQHSNVTEVAVLFAKGLTRLSDVQDEQGMENTMRRLEKLCLQYPDVTEIAVSFAKGLANLSCIQYEQNKQGVNGTVRYLKKLYFQHPNVTEIAVSFAKGLANLSCVQDKQGIDRTVRCLEKLCIQHPDVIEVAVSFASGLVNLSSKQGRMETVSHLEKLYLQYPDVTEITVSFAKGLSNLSLVQDEQGAERTIRRLEKLYAKHSDMSEIPDIFAISLYNLCYVQDEQGTKRTIGRLEKLYAECPDCDFTFYLLSKSECFQQIKLCHLPVTDLANYFPRHILKHGFTSL